MDINRLGTTTLGGLEEDEAEIFNHDEAKIFVGLLRLLTSFIIAVPHGSRSRMLTLFN